MRRLPALILALLAGCAPSAGGRVTPLDSSMHAPARVELSVQRFLYVANALTSTVTVYATSTGKLVRKLRFSPYVPQALAADQSGNLYVAKGCYDRIGTFYPGSVAVFSAGGARHLRTIAAGMRCPHALAFDGYGNLYVADDSTGTVTVYPRGGKRPSSTLVWGSYSNPGAAALAVDAQNTLYVAFDRVQYAYPYGVLEFAYGNTRPSKVLSYGIQHPVALALDADGTLYVGNAPKPKQPNPKGFISIYTSGSATPARAITTKIDSPVALAIDQTGNLIVANMNGRSVGVYPSGASSPSHLIANGVASPDALAIDAVGRVYVANLYVNTVTVYAHTTYKLLRTIRTDVGRPSALLLN